MLFQDENRREVSALQHSNSENMAMYVKRPIVFNKKNQEVYKHFTYMPRMLSHD